MAGRNVWWEQVSVPRSFLADLTSTIADGGSVLLNVEETTLPYATTFRSLVTEQLTARDGMRILDSFASPAGKIGPFLMDRYVKTEKQTEYRLGESLGKFFAEARDIVFHDRILWVKQITQQEKLDEWLDFARVYLQAVRKAKRHSYASFIFELSGEVEVRGKEKEFRYLSYGDTVQKYSQVAYATLLTSNTTCPEYLKPYLMELTLMLCGEEVELYEACIAQWERLCSEPEVTWRAVSLVYGEGKEQKMALERTSEQVAHLVWLAQLRTIFPVLEKFRLSFITRYNEILAAYRGPEFKGDPCEAELGMLKILVASGQIPVTQGERNLLTKAHAARNLLAHLRALDFAEAEYLLKVMRNEE